MEAGAFDAMAAEALREAEAGKTIPLDEILDGRRVPQATGGFARPGAPAGEFWMQGLWDF